jgi:hypothetical protein
MNFTKLGMLPYEIKKVWPFDFNSVLPFGAGQGGEADHKAKPQRMINEFYLSEILFGKRDTPIPDILFGDFVEEDVDLIFWNLKRLNDGVGNFLDQFFLLRRGPPLHKWH